MARSDAPLVELRQGTNLVEKILWGEQCLAYIIRASFLPEQTTFLTPPEYKQQVGYVVYPAGGQIQRHVHRPLERHLVGTSEVLVVGYLSSTYRDAIAFGILILVLILRPQGILGRVEREKV